MKWSELNRFKEDEERYFLYFADLNAITIKKEPDNMNEQEIKEHQTFLKRKVKKLKDSYNPLHWN
ncbi:YcxB family protein [Roseburia sp. 1XD42-34]|uniref:YcxB family protein n=1 Tax=Roseburia sp. 1XD42-34 TaxID=2305905 RepID=UPI000EA3E84F|nr:YcxB family protein [Roseburia sp. 1XD42-34]RKI74094.1 YcxB family protein [Clostridium sp. 1xD42-85]